MDIPDFNIARIHMTIVLLKMGEQLQPLIAQHTSMERQKS